MSAATPTSSWSLPVPYENPVPAGWSMYSTFAFEFHECGFDVVPDPSAVTLHGPFSPKRATSLEHPGPPVIHSTTGSVDGFDRDSKNQ